ncbi:PASTA domain-containing protein, partial [Nocardia zapadnayensis]
ETAYIPPQQPTQYSAYQESRANHRRNGMIWAAVVVVLTLLVGIGGWWLGMGRYATVPSVAGMTVQNATSELQDAGFETGTRDKASDTVPVGGVVGTDPGPGARETKGSTVDILVSSGKPQVPAVSPGADWDEVQQLIRDQGLQPVDGGEVASTAPEGTLARIDPGPGTVLPAGAHVQVWKSNGSKPVQLPDLRADTPDQARQTLTDLGLTVGGERPVYDKLVEAGRVIGTDPAVGTTVDAGSSVTLLICEAVTMPSVTGKKVSEARHTLESLGLTVQVRQLAPLDSSAVVSQNPPANANVEPGATVTIVAFP